MEPRVTATNHDDTAAGLAGPDAGLDIDGFGQLVDGIRTQIARVIVGQDELVRTVLASLFVGGHVLLEGVPGLGKTLLLRTLADTLELQFTRVQCTPDLMPADIVGTTVIGDADADGAGRFQPGPVFSQVLLADEINRASPKTQSALLEAMAEGSVTVGGVTRRLPLPFFVMATQNPIEMEGTYPLPEAQLDRFLTKLLVTLPPTGDLIAILQRTTGVGVSSADPVAGAAQVRAAGALVRSMPIAEHVLRHAVDLIQATHPGADTAPEAVHRYVAYGASPRGAQALVLLGKASALLDGRTAVAIDDIRAAAHPCLRHRVVVGYEALAADVDTDQILDALLDAVPAPRPPVRGAGVP
jgi:MoxR-like ATPase